MYAEERQQAIADLVTRRGRMSVIELSAQFAVTTETVRRDLSTLETLRLVRRVHGGAVAADALTVLETGLSDRDLANTEEKDRIAAAALDLLPARRRHGAARRGQHHRPAGRALPRDRRLTVVTHAVPIAPGSPASPASSCTCCPAGSAAQHPAAVGDRDGRGAGPAPRRRRLPRHQRHHRRPRPLHARPRRGRHQARDRLQRAAGRGARRRQQDRRRAHRALRRAARGRRAGHRRRHRRPTTATPSRRPASRSWSHDRHPDPQPEHRPHRRARRPAGRGAVQRVDAVVSQAGGKGVNISRAAVSAGIAVDRRAPGRPRRPLRPRAAQRRHRLPPVQTRRRGPGQPHDHRARRHHHQAQQPGRVHGRRAPRRPVPGAAPPGRVGGLGGAGRARCRRAHPTTGTPTWCSALHDGPAQVAVDTSEAPLAALVDALPASAPDLMKPNGEELASFTGEDADALESDPRAAATAARTLVDRGVGAVLATLGANGAVLVTAEGAWHATPPPTTVVSTVGAGDSSLFGYLLGDAARPRAARPAGAGGGVRQRRRRPARHHDPRARAGPPRAGRRRSTRRRREMME